MTTITRKGVLTTLKKKDEEDVDDARDCDMPMASGADYDSEGAHNHDHGDGVDNEVRNYFAAMLIPSKVCLDFFAQTQSHDPIIPCINIADVHRCG